MRSDHLSKHIKTHNKPRNNFDSVIDMKPTDIIEAQKGNSGTGGSSNNSRLVQIKVETAAETLSSSINNNKDGINNGDSIGNNNNINNGNDSGLIRIKTMSPLSPTSNLNGSNNNIVVGSSSTTATTPAATTVFTVNVEQATTTTKNENGTTTILTGTTASPGGTLPSGSILWLPGPPTQPPPPPPLYSIKQLNEAQEAATSTQSHSSDSNDSSDQKMMITIGEHEIGDNSN